MQYGIRNQAFQTARKCVTVTMPELQRAHQERKTKRGHTRRNMLRAAAATVGITAAAATTRKASTHRFAPELALADLQEGLNGQLLVPTDDQFPGTNVPVNRRYQDIISTAIARCT